MGGVLGMALGTALNAAGGYAQAKAQKQQQHDQLLLGTYQQHPEIASTPEAQAFLKKKYGPDVADMFMQAGQVAQNFSKQLAGPGNSSPSPAGSPGGGGGGVPSTTTAAASSPGDPMQSHIGQLDSDIQRFRGLQAQYASDPQRLGIINQALQSAEQQRTQLVGQQFSAEKQQEGFQQQSKIESERIGQQDKTIAASGERQDKALAALGDRLAKSEAFQNDMQTRREQQQNHLQDLKDAKTAGDRSLKMKQIIASLGKTTSDLTAKLGKGSDYSQQQREMSAESHNQYIDSLASITDDPDQIAALQKLKINVGAATPGTIQKLTGGVLGSETAGAVGGDATVSKSGKKIIADPKSPSGYSYAD